MPTNQIDDIASRLDHSNTTTVLTGAGMSAPSGVPTFRGQNGLWNNRRAEELATLEAFSTDPQGVWEWYAWRREQIAQCEPNNGHHILAKWSHLTEHFTVITQNVDGLHERAATRNVIPFHGSLWSLKCLVDCQQNNQTWLDSDISKKARSPLCPNCGGIARPAVIWFGESIENAVMQASISALRCELFFVIGTSALVQPAASFAQAARSNGAFIVEVNTERTPISNIANAVFEGACDDILTQIDQARTLERTSPRSIG